MSERHDAEDGLLAGRYRIGAQIGAGGMGAVHRGVDERLRRDVAIKVLPAKTLGDAGARERLRREAMSGAALNHPNIAHVYDVGETEDGGAYLVMELVAGESLRALMGRDAWDDLARIGAVIETARALGAAHRAGLVHRDVKPDNVMLRSDGRVVLLDFGIAKPGGEGTDVALTAAGAIVGTPAYLAPEQALGELVDPRTDQFALAVSAYELLARSLPWPSSSGATLIAAILRDPPLPLEMNDRVLATAIRPVLDRALSKRREARFPDVDAFADALREAAGLTVSLRPLAHSAPGSSGPVAFTPPALAATERLPSTPTPAELARTEQPRGAPTPAELAHTEALAVTSPTPTRPRNRWRLPAAGVGLVALAGAFLVAWRTRPNPLAVSDPVLACVVFEGVDDGAPAGWLGAAAASRFCEYAAPALGGLYRHVRFPADLLGLPRHWTDSFPDDPFEEPEARRRSIAEAKSRGLPYADGRVEATDGHFQVTVTLHASSGRELGSANGKGESLGEATGAALDGLMAKGAVPVRPALDAYVNEFYGSRTIQQAILDTKFQFEVGEAKERLCVASTSPGPGTAGWLWASNCVKPPPVVPRPDPSDVPAQVVYNLIYNDLRPVPERASELDAIRKALPGLHDPTLRAVATLQLDDAWGGLSNPAELAAADLDPRLVATSGGFDLAQVAASDGVGPRAASAWAPDYTYTWRGRGLSKRAEDVARVIDWWRRAYLLNPTAESALEYASAAESAGHLDAVLAVSARLSTSASAHDRAIAAVVDSRVLASRGELAAAYDKLLALFSKEAKPGSDGATLHPNFLLRMTRETALLLGRGSELADWIVDRYVREGETLTDSSGIDAGVLAATCSYASPEKARRCLAHLHEASANSVQGTADLIDAAERWVNGDVSGAAAAARRAMRQNWFVIHCADFLESVFDAAGAYDLSEEVDRPTLGFKGLYSGVNWRTVLRARRAFARGDRENGKKLAQRIIDAYKLADAPVPAVEEMRRQLEKP